MPWIRHRRVLVITVVAAAVAVALSGCSGVRQIVSTVGHAFEGSSLTPAVGECWQSTYAIAEQAATWSHGLPVQCTSSHESYTYDVPPIDHEFSGSWLEPGTDGQMRTDIANAAWETCWNRIGDIFPTLDDKQHLLYVGYYLPSLAAWDKGARWVRCDISLIQIGSTLAAPRLARLPASIRTLIAVDEKTPEKLELCIDTKDPSATAGPLDAPGATYADCTGEPQWRQGNYDFLPGDSTAIYPDDATIQAFIDTTCGTDPEGWFAYNPSQDTWDGGDREVDCWVVRGGAAHA